LTGTETNLQGIPPSRLLSLPAVRQSFLFKNRELGDLRLPQKRRPILALGSSDLSERPAARREGRGQRGELNLLLIRSSTRAVHGRTRMSEELKLVQRASSTQTLPAVQFGGSSKIEWKI